MKTIKATIQAAGFLMWAILAFTAGMCKVIASLFLFDTVCIKVELADLKALCRAIIDSEEFKND